MVYSAALFGLPTGLYHFALARVKDDAVLLGIVIAVIAAVYLPTCFFIIGEYNTTYAAVVAAMAVVLTPGPRRLSDAVLLCLLGLLCVRSYETMVYLGLLIGAAILWSTRKDDDRWVRGLMVVAAVAFIAAAGVALVAIVDYWNHPHFLKVRAMSFDFWQNLQFAIPLAGLAISAAVALLRPSWLQGSGPPLVIAIAATALALSPWYRLVHEHSILYPPAHYLARQAAGVVLAVLLGCMWLHVAWQRRPPRVFTILRLPAVSRRLVLAMTALLLAAAVPDVVADRPVVGLSRAHARPGRHTRGRHPDARPAAARVARQALRPGLVPAGDERPHQPHARPRLCAGRQGLPQQPAVRSRLRDDAASQGLWLGEMIGARTSRSAHALRLCRERATPVALWRDHTPERHWSGALPAMSGPGGPRSS